MNLLLKKTPQSEIKNHVLPMIYQALEQNSPQLQVSLYSSPPYKVPPTNKHGVIVISCN